MSGRKTEMVYQWLLEYIDEHKFSGDLKLPSENSLSRRLSVGRETVRNAFSRLEAEELIYKIRGSGTYIRKENALSRDLDTGDAEYRIGLILQGQDGSANARLIQGITDCLKESFPSKRTDLNIYLTDNKFSNERRCLQSVMGQNFQGFIIDGVKASLINPNLDCYQAICEKQTPVIFYNNYYKELPYPRVIVDNMKCADELVRMLVQAGHRQIAGIFVYDNFQSVEKFQGMVKAMRKYQVEFQDDYVKWCVSNEAHQDSFVQSIDRFLRGLPLCTAIICCNYMIYGLVRKALAVRGKCVPEDYSLVCFDYSGDAWEEEGITCSISQSYLTGQKLAANLMKMIERRECSGVRYSCLMQPEIYVGTSIRRINSL
ncbi:MAG: GntR family transcriptional regulator [Lachnospiraceae bacterium]|nr:GntR family transcriptional regulator [Lachnospiraceae bacterium]